MLATVSHELRSPLAVIKGTAQTLARHDQRLSPEERQEFFTAITQASGRLEQIIEDMLELSQLEAGTYPFEPMLLNLPALLQESAQTATAAEREVVVRTVTNTDGVSPAASATASPSLLVHGDRRLLRRFLAHVVRNAVLYSPLGSTVELGFHTLLARRPTLSDPQQRPASRAVIVALPHTLADHARIDLWVRDHGLGIAPEHLAHVCERFYRVDTRLTRENNGLGLGLAICQQIAVLHHGGLWIESELGQGTTLHLELVIGNEETNISLV
jgi:signal transduction histidine kinase